MFVRRWSLHSVFDVAAHNAAANAAAGQSFGRLAAHADGECRLLGDVFGYTMQLLLFVMCMTSLLVKWHLEKPQRRFKIFVLDTSKQCVGAGWYHILNISLSIFLNSNRGYSADECAWYWSTFMLDSTLGLVCNWLILRASEKALGYTSGDYDEEPGKGDHEEFMDSEGTIDYWQWAKQGLTYCAIITVSKCLVSTLLFVDGVAAHLGVWGTMWIADPNSRLVFVMVITPTIMNTISFWVTDEFIRRGLDHIAHGHADHAEAAPAG
jgi:hypothetical protein